MCKRIDEERERTRGRLALTGLWILALEGLVFVLVFVFHDELGIPAAQLSRLQVGIFPFAGLEWMAFRHYFLRRRGKNDDDEG